MPRTSLTGCQYPFFLTLIAGMEEKSLKLRVLEDVLKTLDCPVLPDFGDIGQKQV